MDEVLRSKLYILGFLSTILFSFRTAVQWIQSEKKGRSIASFAYWKISILANVILAIHSFIQLQYHICLVQSFLATLGTRSINLRQPIEQQWSFGRFIKILILVPILVTCAFAYVTDSPTGQFDWIKTPKLPWARFSGEEVSARWHLFGTASIFLFSLRFWIHWWQAEKHGQEDLSPQFWIASFIGATCSLVYFIKIHDVVNIAGYGFAYVPMIRNYLILKKRGVIDAN
jgi:lipid-A-disaccharide synthase-like uncharacterized protein